jgi:hypothetical protein
MSKMEYIWRVCSFILDKYWFHGKFQSVSDQESSVRAEGYVTFITKQLRQQFWIRDWSEFSIDILVYAPLYTNRSITNEFKL